MPPIELQAFADPAEVARHAAAYIAGKARDAVMARGRFNFAVSGGHTPGPMLRALAGEDVPWLNVHVFQVDERVAPPRDPDRNVSLVYDNLVERVALPPLNLHAMRVEATDLAAAAAAYAQELATFAGTPPVLDLVHLGLGPDGHTASLVPRDPVLAEDHADVALTGTYQGRRRMTLTYPALYRARTVLFVVTGADKAAMVARLVRRDPAIPAGRVTGQRALIMADAGAAGVANA